jgi:hypothetical protein
MLILDPPTIGRIARRKTRTPIPPIQWVKLLQKSEVWDRASISVRIVDPVVVKPEAVSKIQSIYEGISLVIKKGSAPTMVSSIQLNPTMINPSFE